MSFVSISYFLVEAIPGPYYTTLPHNARKLWNYVTPAPAHSTEILTRVRRAAEELEVAEASRFRGLGFRVLGVSGVLRVLGVQGFRGSGV